MDIAAHGRGDSQRTVRPFIPSSSLADRSGTGTTASLSQGETSEHGFPTVLNTDPSYPPPSLESHTFPSPSIMSGSDNQLDTSRFIQPTTEMRWTSQSPQRPPYDVTRPHFFTSDALQPASLPRRTSEPTFPLPPFPAQTSSGPLHTHHNYFPGQYVMHSHLLPFHNQPGPLNLHDGYGPSGPNSYPPFGYYPLPLHPPLPYFRNGAGIQNTPSYQQAQHPHAPISQSATILPGSFSSGGARRYLTPPYSSATYTGLPSQGNVHQWHHNLGSPTNTFSTRARRGPVGYSQSWSQHSRRSSNTISIRSVESERLPSPTPGASGGPLGTASRNTVSSITAELPEHISSLDLSKPDIREPSQRPVVPTTRANDRPLVRRRYHPNPPPNRSEWVMWVGNVPNDAKDDELWQFLSLSAPLPSGSKDSGRVKDSGIVSLFLLSRSHCAFVNYHSEEQLNNAIDRFNGHQLRPNDPRCPRLVCRARRKDDDLRAGVGAQRGMGMHTRHMKGPSNKNNEWTGATLTSSKRRRSSTTRIVRPPLLPVPRDGGTLRLDTLEGTSPKVPTRSPSSHASTTSSFLIHYFPKRFFILKSLTQYDLDLSVERGIWATQTHNESILDQAFRTSKEVILIFSVNKSGEFYGYGRMSSAILRSSRSDLWAPRADPSPGMPSPASGDHPSQDAPDLPGSSSQSQSPELHAVSQSQLAEATLAPSSNKTNADLPALSAPQPKSTRERQSAPPVFARSSEPRSPLRRKPHSAPLPIPGKHSGAVLAGRDKNGGVLIDDTSNHGVQLQPVMEEVCHGSSSEEDRKPHLMDAQSHLPSRPHAQQDEPSWGGTFRVEWLRTDRVPFHHTRHLRNPWNHGREVKVARDGTELEPSVGQQLIEDWPNLAGAAGRRAQASAVGSSSGETKGVRDSGK